MSKITMLEIYDRLHILKDNPLEFEKELNIILEEFMEDFEEDRKLKFERILWVQRNKLNKYKDPIVRANKSLEIMWNSFMEMKEELKKI